MRLVHLSDLHLGYHRQSADLAHASVEIKQRELDVGDTFARTVRRIIELAPDVVVITGDIFDALRPSNTTILHAFTQLSRLRVALPNAALVMIAGDHDTPRVTDAATILTVLAETGVVLVERKAEWVNFPVLDLAILAVPGGPGIRAAYTPDPVARYNVLALHGSIEGSLPVDGDDVLSEGWNYVALGHYHVHRQLAPNVCYAGSMDYTSSNFWGEVLEERLRGLPGKGFVERDLDTGAQTFHHVPTTRRILDIAAISGLGLTPEEISEKVVAAADAAGIDGAIVRMRVVDVSSHVMRDLDHRAIRSLRRRAAHFQLELRAPSRVAREVGAKDLRAVAGVGGARQRPPLEAFVEGGLRARDLPADIDREQFVKAGLEYLRDADDGLGAVEPTP